MHLKIWDLTIFDHVDVDDEDGYWVGAGVNCAGWEQKVCITIFDHDDVDDEDEDDDNVDVNVDDEDGY